MPDCGGFTIGVDSNETRPGLYGLTMSGDANIIAFQSYATNLVIGDSILPLSTVISLNEHVDLGDHTNDDTENPDVPTEEAAA